MKRSRPIRRKRRPTIVSVAAGDVVAGDLLWSDASMEAWRIVATHRELMPSSGNLLAGILPEDAAAGPRTIAVVLTVVDELTGKRTQRLGGYAPRAQLQVVQHVARASVAG